MSRRSLFRLITKTVKSFLSSSTKPQTVLDFDTSKEIKCKIAAKPRIIDSIISQQNLTQKVEEKFVKGVSVKTISRDDKYKMLHVQWSNGMKARFLYAWLRDNCPESHTYNLSPICKARIMVMNDLDVDVQPTQVENLGDKVSIIWPNDKKSYYTSDWLQERNLDDVNLRQRRKEVHLTDTELWSSDDMKEKMKWINFEQILNDDLTLHDTLTTLCKLGIVFIDSVPAQLGQLEKIAKRIGFEYLTHYGSVARQRVQALHCIEQVKSSGGENQFVDGFRVAKIMADKYPELYEILCTVPLEYVDDGQDFIKFDLTYSRPVFNFDSKNRLTEIHFSNQQRSWFYDVPVEKLGDVYRAMKTFNNLMRSTENSFELKMHPGQMIVFHNVRVLHGRSSFNLNHDSGSRLMEGCYFNLDIIKSKIRVLRDLLDLKPNQISV